MTIRAETLRAMRTIACRRPGETPAPTNIQLTTEEARELFEAYTTARMFESATEHARLKLAAAATREAALETRLAAAEAKLAAANAAELRGAERLIPNVVCSCSWSGIAASLHRVDDTDCPSHGPRARSLVPAPDGSLYPADYGHDDPFAPDGSRG